MCVWERETKRDRGQRRGKQGKRAQERVREKPMERERVVKRFREGLLAKDHRFWYHSTLVSRVITKKKKKGRARLHQQQTTMTVLPERYRCV